MALSRPTAAGWLIETGERSRPTAFGWVIETQSGSIIDYSLSATPIVAGTPVLGTPSIPTGGNDDLAATGIESQSPVLGVPALVAGILGANIPTEGEHGGSPVPNDFTITPTALYAWEVVTPPSAGTLEIFADLTFTWDAAGVTDGDYSWVYRLYENGVSVGTATVYMHAGALVVVGITAGAPILGTPVLSSYDPGVLIADGIAAGAPVFGTPTLTQQHAMMADGITTPTPVLGSPTLTATIPGVLTLTEADIAAIASAVVAALQATTIPVNATKMNSAPIVGTGAVNDPWRGQGVQL